MAAGRPRIKVPKTAKKGDSFEIKTLITHPMETGIRKGKDGKPIPRNIINKFVCSFNKQTVFSATLHPSVSANPYISFFQTAQESGAYDFVWTDDSGKTFTKSVNIEVA